MRRAIRDPLDVGVRSINSLLVGGRRTAHRPVRRIRRRQVGAARHDDALHQGGCDRGRPDRRARPRGAGFRQQYLGAGRHAARRGGRHARRQSAAHAAARRVARDRHRRVFPRPGHEGAAAARFADPLRPGAARDRARHRRAARDQGLSALGVRAAAATGRARRQQRPRRRARSPRSTPCSPKATIRTIRSRMPRAPSWTATSCCRGGWRKAGCIRRSTSRHPSAARCIRSRPASSSISRRASSRSTRPISRTGI